MSKPKIERKIGGYSFSWPEGIEIFVSRMRVHNSDGRVTGELLVKKGEKTLYPQTQVNFSADRTRNALAKNLADRYNSQNWQAIIDQLSYHVQEKSRQGEPVEELWTSEEVKPPEYVIYPFIMFNQPNVVFGPPESGKTQMALEFCLIMMLPEYDNHLNLAGPAARFTPLWLDYEADRNTTLWNFTRVVNGAGVGHMSLLYRRCRMPLADDIEQISNHLRATGANCIIIDSLGKAAGGDLDKSESPTLFYNALDQLECTSLILAHTSKEQPGQPRSKKSIYGNTHFEAYARSVWEVRSSRDGDTLHVGFWDNKANFRGRLDPVSYSLDYDDTHIFMNVEDIKTVDDFIRHLSLSGRILDALRDGPKSPKELKDLVGEVASATFYAELARMYKRGKLTKIGLGKDVQYALPF